MSENSVTLVGNLGADPEVKVVNGKPVATLRLATNRSWKSADGKKTEEVTWHRVVVWGKQAESCGQYLTKGRQVLVKGRISNRSYQDTTGKMHYVSEVVASKVDFLGGSGKSTTRTESEAPRISAEEAFPL